MSPEDAALVFIHALNDLRAHYMLVGSLSSNYYGIPRATKDVDLVLDVAEDMMRPLAAKVVPAFRLDPQIGFETKFMTTKHLFIGTGELPFTVEVFSLSDDRHDQERYRRRVPGKLGPEPAWFPTPEDVVIQKLRWGRRKDFLDVVDVISVQTDRLDWGYIMGWCQEHGSLPLLEKARQEAAA